MNSIVLTDEEIEAIKALVEELKEIPLVECIHIRPLIEFDKKVGNIVQETAEIHIEIVWNNSSKYDSLVALEVKERNIQAEADNFNEIYAKYDEIFKNLEGSRVIVSTLCSKTYSKEMINFIQVLAEYALVNSTILFDRYGALTENKEAMSKFISQDEKIPVIENIGRVISSGSKTSG